MKSCHRCSAPWPATIQAGFNNTCEGCGTPVHCCANCVSYQPRCQRRCALESAPDILDGSQANRCELFQFALAGAAGIATDSTIADVRRQLLKDDKNDKDAEAPSRSWDQLFSD